MCWIAAACLLLGAGSVQADLRAGDVDGALAVSLSESAVRHTIQSKYRFDRSLREAHDDADGMILTAMPLSLPGDTTTTAIAVPTADFDIGDGGLLDEDSTSEWPSGRHTENSSSRIDYGGSVTGNVSEVPLPASVLLAMIGLGLAGAGRARFAQRG